tara:strand:+ start:254 stop:463 length:210 start_codon:yes stop_codon:yes gene_type:complete
MTIKGLHNRANEYKAHQLLNESDWTQLSDCELTDACIAKFVTYRKELRVIRKTNPSNPTFPTIPTEEWK